MDPDFLLIAAILFGGVGGAAANFLLMPPSENDVRTFQTFLRLAVGSVFVAFTVPLFLSLAQSTLVQQILSPQQGHNTFPDILIFTGFCIVISFSSRAFMTNLSARILADVAKTKEIAKEASEKVNHVEEAVGETIDRVTGEAKEQQIEQWVPSQVPKVGDFSLTPEEIKTLQAAGHLTMRTATGISEDAGIPRHQIGEILDSLTGKSLIEKTKSPNTGGLRHRLTPLGIAVLNDELKKM